MENTKIIGGVSIEDWKKAFAQAVANAFDKDDFSDILFFNLYPNTSEEAANIDEDDEEAIDEVYNSKWTYAYEAFEEVFGLKQEELY
jgi:hypothetical protein